MTAIEVKAFAINEFEAVVNVFARYRGKSCAVRCTTAIKTDDQSYYVLVPRDVKCLSGKMTTAMESEAKMMFHNLRYNELVLM